MKIPQNIRIGSKKGVSKEYVIFMYIFFVYTINLPLSQLQDDINTQYRINLFSYPFYNNYFWQKQNYDQTNNQSNKRTTNFKTHKTSLCPGYNLIFIFGFSRTLFKSPIMIVFVSRNLISTPQKICSFNERRKNCFTHGTILCPGYKVNKLSFCRVFLQ